MKSCASDYSGSSIPSACVEKKRKCKKIKLKEEQLDLQCEWRDCDYRTSNLDHFVPQVSVHLPHLEVKRNENQEGTGSVVFLMILPASSSTWQSHFCSHMLSHINFCSLLKYCESDVIVSDILDSDHLPIVFHILDHDNVKNLSEPIEKFTDWDRFQSLASELITSSQN
jgi:hypothetical protein